MAGGGKNKLEHIKQETPKFLRDFKARVGYKEGPTVETKKRKDIQRPDSADDDDDAERDDELPTICVLKEGDITEEEYKSYKKADKAGDAKSNKDALGNERIIFKAPAKRKKEQDNKQKTSKGTKERQKGSSKVKKLDNKNLLSFAEDED